ncbi:DEAD/DEAH box helicase [Spirulina sp. CS-785/01]|uniref:DEAD/DEAH box helicase n=1 Tax=Spirulina sp. CS-785/01 TaxID=3021716 RepID=UPI00232B2E6D|nr:DEAD/DEAH box helicase [Spirulina sp. CS-785/01]MDB9314988.1 DEAD/DEAH box helicase [Spirulina sp. CS-785/01]
MPYHELYLLLDEVFAQLNTRNATLSPDEVWQIYNEEVRQVLEQDDDDEGSTNLEHEFTNLGNGLYLPKALEATRLLQQLRQRFDANGNANPLVGRIRAAVVEKQRPIRNIARHEIPGIGQDIVQLTPESFTQFSRFQVEGWERVHNTIENREGIVVVAPTGSGKTEVFLMPVIYAIAQSLRQNPNHPYRFITLYPRVALLKDQLARIFRYVHHAEQVSLTTGQLSFFGSETIEQGIVIGFQFGGICANAADTFDNRDIFTEDSVFRIVDQCPICGQGQLRVDRDRRSRRYRGRNIPRGVHLLYCDNPSCGNGSEFHVSIAKNDHAIARPHILVTTAESLDRLYLNPKPEFENYLRQLTGIVFDEVHLYYSIYGVHIHNLVRRLEEWQGGQRLVKIASSATIADPERFIANFFYGSPNHSVLVHSANDYEQEPAGLEVLYFLQSPEGRINAGAAPTLIQSVMAMGHGVLGNNDRAIVFSDSLDMAGRLTAQISDAEGNKRLWKFRTLSEEIRFQNMTCPGTSPSECPIYLQGECWRGILGNENCSEIIECLQETPLEIISVSSKQKNDYREGDILVATPTLEVGVDDERIKSTIHYLPPRTVFSFIQKRGRAGRSSGEIAYTLMVLDTTPSSQFYFFRRNRLINGHYELPLNPENEVVRGMHDLIQRERERMGQCFQNAGNNSIQGIWCWVWETLNQCHILQRYYSEHLRQLDQYPRNATEQGRVRRILRDWIEQEKRLLGNYLSLQQLLEQIQEETPQELHLTVQDTIHVINRFLSNDVTADNVRQQLNKLDLELGQIYYSDEANQELLEQITAIQRTVRETWLSLSRQLSWGIELHHVECLYDFFRSLQKLYEPKILNMAPDVLKIVLQSLFYLHLGLNEADIPEGSDYYSYYIPDAYFQTVKPIIIEARYLVGSRTNSDLYQENLTELSTTFIPYKTVYRYRPSPESRPNPNISYLTILSLEHRPDWVNQEQQTVSIRLRSEGVTRGGIHIPKKVYVKFIESDQEGQQIVSFCPQCYAIHSIRKRRCNCHQELQRVKLYAEPIVERSYEALTEPQPIIDGFHFIERMRGTTTVRGSSVQARRVYWDEQVRFYRYIARVQPYNFNALYDLPVEYGIPTKGIIWNLSEIVEQIMEDDELRHQVEEVRVNGTNKEFNHELILHTAAHLLHRAIASISGVNEQELEYWFDVTNREVVVWERYEGGAGISEVFVNTLRTQALEVYQELLASVLCPVNLAENPNWTSVTQLRTELAQHWHLEENNALIVRITQEAEAERQAQLQQEEERIMCRPPEGHDGCPACIHTTYCTERCTERNEQSLRVSRMVGEAFLEYYRTQYII